MWFSYSRCSCCTTVLMTGVWILVGVRDFALFQVSQMGWGAYSAFHSVGVVGKAADHLPASSVEFNDGWNYTCTPLYAFMAYIKLYLFLLLVHTNLRLVWHLDAYVQGILKYYSGQFTLNMCIMGLYLLPSEYISGHFIWAWVGVYVLSTFCHQGILETLDCLGWTFIFMGPVFVLQVHARKFCAQFIFLLMFITLKSVYPFGAEVKEVWSYNFIWCVVDRTS